MIRLEQATKYARVKGFKKPIIENASLVINRGRSIGLLGRNGAGKSTLLQLIAGSLQLDGGLSAGAASLGRSVSRVVSSRACRVNKMSGLWHVSTGSIPKN